MTNHSHAQHDHAVAADADRRYLVTALVLIAVFMVAEVVVGALVGSLVLLADAGHMLTDVLAIAAALWAARLASRPANPTFTFGLKRAEILSAAANGITLLVIGTVIAVEAVQRLVTPSPVGGAAVLIMAIAGVVVNIAAAWALARANRSSLNVEGAFQHVLTDLYGFIGTAIAGVVILTTGFVRADAIAALLVVALMARAAFSLLKASGRILLEATPEHLDLATVRTHILEIPEVVDVHDLHAWLVTSGQATLSAHIVLADECFTDGHAPRVLEDIQSCVAAHFDVEHSTFQFEPPGRRREEHAAHG